MLSKIKGIITEKVPPRRFAGGALVGVVVPAGYFGIRDFLQLGQLRYAVS